MILLWVGAAVVSLAAAVGAVGAPASYVGGERCKLCHRSVYQSWLATPHARTQPAAGAEDRCYQCHATEARRLPAVQCESCHGPGSDYSLPEVMIDPEKRDMAGLIRPSVVVCERCHENHEPGHRGNLVMPERNEWTRWIHEVKEP